MASGVVLATGVDGAAPMADMVEGFFTVTYAMSPVVMATMLHINIGISAI